MLEAKYSVGASYMQNSILKIANSIKYGFKYRIGKGAISIWCDKWLEGDLICNMLPYVDIQDTQLKIKDIYYDNAWHWEKLATQIPLSIKMQMQSHFVDEGSKDILIWSFSNSRIYSARDGYKWLIQHVPSQPTESISWSWVWKLKTHENLKHFLWIALHKCLPTNSFKTFRHVSNDPSCQRCDTEQESLMHTLRDCPKAKRVWSMLNIDQCQNFYTLACKDWLITNT